MHTHACICKINVPSHSRYYWSFKGARYFVTCRQLFIVPSLLSFRYVLTSIDCYQNLHRGRWYWCNQLIKVLWQSVHPILVYGCPNCLFSIQTVVIIHSSTCCAAVIIFQPLAYYCFWIRFVLWDLPSTEMWPKFLFGWNSKNFWLKIKSEEQHIKIERTCRFAVYYIIIILVLRWINYITFPNYGLYNILQI